MHFFFFFRSGLFQNPRSGFSILHVKGYVMPVRPVNGGVPFDHLVKAVSARCLHCKIANSTFSVSLLWEVFGIA